MKNPILVPELRELLFSNNVEAVKDFCASTHPATVAEFLSALEPKEIRRALDALDADLAAEIFNHLDEDIQSAVIEPLRRDELARLVTHMAPDDRVDLLKRIPEEKQHALLQALAVAEREDIRRLASYEEGTVGSIMTTEYATLAASLTAREAIERLRAAAPDKETIYYAYVVDDARKLLGFVSLKDLILARPDSRVEDMMHRDVIFVAAQDDQETAARQIAKYDLLAPLPVVNGEGALVGIVTHDDAMDVLVQENQEDMEKFMAIGGSHEAAAYLRTPAWSHFKNRCGWISLNRIAFAVALALGLQVVTSTLIGALLPLGAARLKFDPAVVASPALTTIVDISGLLIFFTTAKVILGV